MTPEFSRRDILQTAKGLAMVTPFLGLVACDGDGVRRRTITFAGATMGTTYSIRVTDLPRHIDRVSLKVAIDGILATVNDQMSNWRTDSEVSTFNDGAPSSWISVSDDTLSVINEALRISRLSGGAFDPTIGTLVDLWGFGPASDNRRVPSQNQIGAALRKTGFQHIRTSASQPAVAKRKSGVEITLCGIAKGFGVDKLAEHLDREGIDRYLVEVGGELRARGHSLRRRPWRIGIERPVAGQRAVQRVVELDGNAIASSGNYKNFFDSSGVRFSHIIDPRTGEPIGHDLASVTVIAPTAMQADALSTALMVLGPDAGLALAEKGNMAALFIVRDGTRFVEIESPEFERFRPG